MSFSLHDLEQRLEKILSSRKTTVSLDTNIFKPFCNVKVPGLDLTKLPTQFINGYDIPKLIIKQRAYNEETANAARHIHEINTAYVDILYCAFTNHDNLILTAQVKRELENWIRGAEIEAYERWAKGAEMPFHSEAMNSLVRIRGKNPYFLPIFQVQHEYKKAVRDLLKVIPEEQVVSYEEGNRLAEIVEQLNGANTEDKLIFGNSLSATIDDGNDTLIIISFDKGMREIAKSFNRQEIRDDIEIRVYTGYSLELDPSKTRLIQLRFKPVYRISTKVHVA